MGPARFRNLFGIVVIDLNIDWGSKLTICKFRDMMNNSIVEKVCRPKSAICMFMYQDDSGK
jgi:hypothetical protein